MFAGYNTGVKNNKPCTKNGIMYRTSLYLMLSAASNVPIPIAERHVMKRLIGIYKIET